MRVITYCVIDPKDKELLDIGNFKIEDEISIDGIRKLVSNKIVKSFYDDNVSKLSVILFLESCFPMNDESHTINHHQKNIYHIKVESKQKDF